MFDAPRPTLFALFSCKTRSWGQRALQSQSSEARGPSGLQHTEQGASEISQLQEKCSFLYSIEIDISSEATKYISMKIDS